MYQVLQSASSFAGGLADATAPWTAQRPAHARPLRPAADGMPWRVGKFETRSYGGRYP